jgi:hypothetical protein
MEPERCPEVIVETREQPQPEQSEEEIGGLFGCLRASWLLAKSFCALLVS